MSHFLSFKIENIQSFVGFFVCLIYLGFVFFGHLATDLDLAHYGEDPLCCSEEPSLGASYYTLWYTD